MNKQQKHNKKGFTIIEVVLVLAIAGLIFLMVFIALPALQRSQKDTQRKNDLSRAQTALSSYQSANRNALPGANDASWAIFATDYLKAGGDTFADPARGDYVFKFRGQDTTNPAYEEDTAEIFVNERASCSGESLLPVGSSKVALRMKLEGGGIACVNN